MPSAKHEPFCQGYNAIWQYTCTQSNSTHVDTASTWETQIRIWTTSLFLDANTASMPDIYQCHVNRACNPWLETWDFAIIHSGGTRICVTVQWITVDHMTLSPTKLILIWIAVVNSCAMIGESKTQNRSIASVHPLHYFATNTEFFTIWFLTNEIWCLDFDSPGSVT